MRFFDRLWADIRELKEDTEDGTAKPVPEDDAPDPVQENGRTKQPSRKLLEPVPRLERIEIFRPVVCNDCQYIADCLKSGNAAIVHYGDTPERTAKQIHMFMFGYIYASDGFAERVSSDIYVYAPKQLEIQNLTKVPDLDSTLKIPWKNKEL